LKLQKKNNQMQLLEEIKHASLNQTKIAVEHSELLMK